MHVPEILICSKRRNKLNQYAEGNKKIDLTGGLTILPLKSDMQNTKSGFEFPSPMHTMIYCKVFIIKVDHFSQCHVLG